LLFYLTTKEVLWCFKSAFQNFWGRQFPCCPPLVAGLNSYE